MHSQISRRPVSLHTQYIYFIRLIKLWFIYTCLAVMQLYIIIEHTVEKHINVTKVKLLINVAGIEQIFKRFFFNVFGAWV